MAVKILSDHDFRAFGLNHIAYVKPMETADHQSVWSVHAADGTTLSVMPTMEDALAALRRNDLRAVYLH